MRNYLHRRNRNRRGSGIVESTLVVMLMLSTLIGIVDVGTILTVHQGMVERARTGARYGVVNSYDTDKITNMVLYNSPEPAAGARPLMNLSTDLVSVNFHSANTPEARIEVKISNYPFHFFTPFIRGSYVARPIVCSMPLEEQSGSAF